MSTRRPKPPQRGTPATKTAPEANSDAAGAIVEATTDIVEEVAGIVARTLRKLPRYGGATMIDYADIEVEADDD